MPPPTVLKRRHSLGGTNMIPLIRKLRQHNSRERITLARVKSTINTEDLNTQELCKHFREITSESEKEMLEMAGKDVNDNNLKLLLHYAILLANENGIPDGQQLQESDDQEDEPAPKKKAKQSTNKTDEHELSDIKQKVRLLATQNNPSESLILLSLDELAKKARKINHEESDTYDELARQASRNQGKVDIVKLALNVLGGKASDVVTKALSKCYKEKEEKSDPITQQNNTKAPEYASPLNNLYPQQPQTYGHNQMMPFMFPYTPYPYGNFQGYRPRFTRRQPLQTATRQAGPCLFCDEMGHLVKDCIKLKAMKQQK